MTGEVDPAVGFYAFDHTLPVPMLQILPTDEHRNRALAYEFEPVLPWYWGLQVTS
jgi:hypothetical protein